MMTDHLLYIDEGHGLPVVFQHGLGADIRQSQAFLNDIEGIRLLGFDAPGHGKSQLAGSTPGFDYYTDLAISLLDQWKIDKAVFGGISMGSGIAVNAALRYPDRLKALILIRPAWLDKPEPENLRILLSAAESIRSGSKEEFVGSDEFNEINRVLPNAGNSVLGVFDPTQQDAIPLVLESMVRDRPFDSLDSLQKIDLPAIIIGSEDDPLHPFEISQEIHQKIGGSILKKVISRYIDDPKHRRESSQLITDFLNTI